MEQYKLKAQSRQAGMTLLELTVVLFILLALAGLIIPSFDRSIATRTDDSTSVSSLAEVDKWIQGYYSVFMKEPNNMEALINGTAGSSTTDTNCNATNAAVNTAYCKMMYTGYFGTTTVNTSTSATVAADLQRAMSLTMAGITSIYYNDPNTTDATFSSTILGNPTPIDDGIVHTLATVVPMGGAVIEAYLATVFGTTADKFDGTCYEYVAFGIGNGSSLTGTLMSSAPVRYISSSSAGPIDKYNYFVAIYQVDKLAASVTQGASNSGCSEGTESAKYIGSVIAGDSEDKHLLGLVRIQGQTHKNMHFGG